MVDAKRESAADEVKAIPASPSAPPVTAPRTVFAANNGTDGNELWISDGTAAGTALLKDINPGSGAGNPNSFRLVDGKVVFIATNVDNGAELWTTDGTAAGTMLLKDINPGTVGSSIGNFTALGSKLLFTATDATNGRELWITDGTAAGTMLLKDINSGTANSSPSNLVAYNGKVIFGATDANGYQLWQTDGTTAGTTRITNITELSAGSLTPAGGKLVFSGKTGSASNDYELWVTDGTAAGTMLLKDIYGGSTGSFPSSFVTVNGKAVFTAVTPTSGAAGALWVSDGTAAGTYQLSAIPKSSNSIVSNGYLFYSANNNGDLELWKTDGTTASLIKDINPTGSSNPTGFFEFGGKVYFRASDGTTGGELWVSDGTAAGTQLVKDINPGAGDSFPLNYAQLGSQFLFSATDATSGRELWISDGTTAGTTLLANINPGSASGSPSNLFTFNAVIPAAAPVLGVNTGSTVLEGGTDTIISTELRYTDADTADSALVYTITSAATNGTLFRSGVVLALNGTFTQADINANLITYTHNGGETTSASFGFSLSDGTTTITGQTFAFTVTPVNDAPTLTATAANPTFTEGAGSSQGAAVAAFSGAAISTAEAGQLITGIRFTVSGLANGASEHVIVDGTDIALTAGASGTTATNGIGYSVSVSAGVATVILTKAGGLAVAAAQTVINGITYQNTNIDNPAPGDRVITLTQITDSGGTANGGADTTTLSIASTVHVAALNDAPAGTDGAVSATEDTRLVLAAANFGFTDVDGNSFDAVRIATVPSGGNLYYDSDGAGGSLGQLLAAGSIVDIATINAGQLVYVPNANVNGADSFTFQVRDNGAVGGGNFNLDPTPNTLTINVAAVDDPPVAVPDSGGTLENATLNGASILANDTDVDGGAKTLATVNGSAGNIGTQITLASGALLTVNADGTYAYNPNGRFNYLVSPATATATGASDGTATDSFTYALNGGSSATVTITITGVDGAGDELRGGSGNDTIGGTPGPDLFNLSQGGDDTVSGGNGDDGYYFGAAYTTGDIINDTGGTLDQLGLRGNYAAGTIVGTITGIDNIVLFSGANTSFGGVATDRFSYNLILTDAAVANGQTLYFTANALLAGENFRLDASLEVTGSIVTYGGFGNETLIGGAQNDGFFFGAGRWGSGDSVNGGGGALDQLALQGNYITGGSGPIVFGAAQIVSIEQLVVLSGAALGSNFSYDITMNNANVAAGASFSVSANQLGTNESLTFQGAAETDAVLTVYGGAGNDVIIGGSLADQLFGGAGADRITGGLGADQLTGGIGNDTFLYTAADQSTAASQDHILDFVGGDRIDLSGIAAFTFITGGFTAASQVRVTSAGGGNYLVEAETTGDGQADLSILVTSDHALTSSDFTGLAAGGGAAPASAIGDMKPVMDIHMQELVPSDVIQGDDLYGLMIHDMHPIPHADFSV